MALSEIPEFSLQDIGLRLKAIRVSKGMSLRSFYGPISAHINNFSAVEHGKRSLGRKVVLDIAHLYHINPMYLDSGKGSMFLDPWPYHSHSEQGEYVDTKRGVPFYNVNPKEILHASFNIDRLKEDYRIDFEPFNDCDAWFPVFGDSMAPQYSNGDLIVVKAVKLSDLILWGEAYLVITKREAGSITTIRFVFPHENPDSLILKSRNTSFSGDTVLKKQTIQSLYLIKGKMTRIQW